MASSVKRVGKKIIAYPEDSVPVVSTSTYFKSRVEDPKQSYVSETAVHVPIITHLYYHYLDAGWLTGDLIAGLTVGIVVVPQGMSYAQLATLPPQYGLYTSFVGLLTYCFFATSKDVSIGPVAVMSLTTAQIIAEVDSKFHGRWQAPEIATTLAFCCGFIVLAIGLLRLGWLVELIPAPAVSGFMTGSAINIATSQLPGLMGISGVNSRAAVYKVIINTLKGLPRTKLDAAWGLIGLVALYSIRITCTQLQRRYPRSGRIFFFIMVARNAVVILVLTIAAWLYCRHRKTASGYPIKILQTVPRGFQNVGPVAIDSELVKAFASQLPIATIILLLEHVAIAKSFGRVNNYKINPNQELIAIGVANTIGSVFHAYPATGSFSRSALQSKSGVRTPASGIAGAVVVIVALYGLTPAFFWIPTAGLSAVIIHAVADLVASPAQVYTYWRVSPLEFFIWLAAVIVTVFSTIEYGIYTSISASLALLLLRVAHPRGYFLANLHSPTHKMAGKVARFFSLSAPTALSTPRETCAAASMSVRSKVQDRPWNDPGPTAGGAQAAQVANLAKPKLRAIIFDFSAFHFASILSPWIQRALIASGFGIGSPSEIPSEIAPVVTYDDEHRDAWKSHSETRSTDVTYLSRGGERVSESTPLMTEETPFFHFDVVAALRAAQSNQEQQPSSDETELMKQVEV
ncbi:sulfate permease [Boletus reticuloceps]|uniref:Sulfate permease n=1 Tax=Boletus reticuloceps TaxID=495285 RepID=A0A8I3ADU3_9AGAM|nr:sulfate permease [Boletus reticuloceps]